MYLLWNKTAFIKDITNNQKQIQKHFEIIGMSLIKHSISIHFYVKKILYSVFLCVM